MNHLYFQGAARRVAGTCPQEQVPPTLPVRPSMEPDAGDFFRLLFAQAGMEMMPYHPRTLSRRLAACMRRLHVRTVFDARRKLYSNPELTQLLLNVVLLGVTEFRRDPAVFHSIQHLVLPDVLSIAHPRIWSAGCSDGQELYSVAMLL